MANIFNASEYLGALLLLLDRFDFGPPLPRSYRCAFCEYTAWQENAARQHAKQCDFRGESAVPDNLPKKCDARSPLLKIWTSDMRSLPEFTPDGSGNAKMVNAVGNVWECDAGTLVPRLRASVPSPRAIHHAEDQVHALAHINSDSPAAVNPFDIPVATIAQYAAALTDPGSISFSSVPPHDFSDALTPMTNPDTPWPETPMLSTDPLPFGLVQLGTVQASGSILDGFVGHYPAVLTGNQGFSTWDLLSFAQDNIDLAGAASAADLFHPSQSYPSGITFQQMPLANASSEPVASTSTHTLPVDVMFF
ncbi:hypothetical protein BKA62DRAFT_766097 [Auriculariales sp. MPI-PUGE-AT-0066]|nr:hypothetical protein BKA62DRAFT_766097 [Auriculariales sp. MPI-PUGE-AT-0066]